MKKITIGTIFVLFVFLLFASVSAVDSNGDGVSILPDPAYDNQDIECLYDFDLGNNLPIYTWEKNSNEQGINTATVDDSYLSAGDDWTCTVSYEQYTGGYPPYIEIEIGSETVEILEGQVTQNEAPLALGARIEVDEGDTAEMRIEVLSSSADFLVKYLASLFGDDDTVYIYDADGDSLDIEVNGQSGFDGESTSNVVAGTTEYYWLTDSNDAGVYTDWVEIDDGESITMVPVYVTVNDVPVVTNNCPIVTAPVPGTYYEGDLITLPVGAIDPDLDPLTYTWTNSVGTTQGNTFTWQTAVGDAGTYTIEVVVSDGDVLCDQTVTITFEVLETIGPVNNCPVVQPVTVGTYYETDLVEFEIDALDADGDPLTYTWTNSVGTTQDNIFTWQTAEGDADLYSIEVVVSDGDVLCDQTVTIDFEVLDDYVVTNNPPEMDEILDVHVDEGEFIEIEVNAWDVDGDAITYTFEGLEDGSVNGNVWSWQTECDDAGRYYLTVSISDGEYVVSQVVEIKVDDVLTCEVPHSGIGNYEGDMLGVTNMFVMNAADLASWYNFDANVAVSGNYRYSNGQLSNVALDNEIVLSMTMENRNSFDARDILVTFIFDDEHSYAAFPDLDRSDSETALYTIEIPDDMESGRYGLKVIVESDDTYEERVFNLDVQSMVDVIEYEVHEPIVKTFWDNVEEFLNSIF
tara:strand:- start:342 stop:2405 length:2064 start_codon:yes stop_codon:yes gene_type:complete